MSTYEEAGVNITAGDSASKKAYLSAMSTFSSRNGRIGVPLLMEGGFSGALDFGDFLLVMNCDGVGTKIDISLDTQNFEGLGDDLLAMVVDDAICTGAETIAITNTIDTNKVNEKEISIMMESLAKACKKEKVVIPGGEIAELGNTLSKTIWNATCIGIVEKSKFLTGEKIKVGDSIIALKETGFRSNGFTLVRHVLRKKNISFSDEYENGKTWGEVLLDPSKIYHSAILSLIGRFQEPSHFNIHGIVHVTGGGIAGNFFRILKKKKLGAYLPHIFEMPEKMKKLQQLGDIEDREAYKTWNAGNGMLLIVDSSDAEKIVNRLNTQGATAQICGEITDTQKILHRNFGFFRKEEFLEWESE